MNRRKQNPNLQFLKLGGSLITEKSRPHTARLEVLARLAQEIYKIYSQDDPFRLILGHGSGSFGHVPASMHGTRNGVHTPEDWQGFVEVWHEAQALHRLVMDSLDQAGLPVLGMSPLASVTADGGKVAHWDTGPLKAALDAGMIPVIYGDVIFDVQRGGTILSTEDLFDHLARELNPKRILLAGSEAGVWADYPLCRELIKEITPADGLPKSQTLRGSAATDVTGGMASKVRLSFDLVNNVTGLEILIFSGEQPGLISEALTGASPGTWIHR
jgi:isopentenyl phosphate kinase